MNGVTSTEVDAALEHEAEIVWEQPPEEMEYVREQVRPVGNRNGSVPKTRVAGIVVGYAKLDRDAPRVDCYGAYRRRVFALKEHDRPRGGDVFEGGVPAEGVDPLTVEPGKPGEVTPRAMGEGDE